jgi:GntR family transcriptional regulator, transcriptional repressor for pyruvate dehydrogenase complex
MRGPFAWRAVLAEIGRVKVEKSFEVLAGRLREQILSGEIGAGESLPNERQLGDETGLSRGSVREALRVLETQGLVSTKAGRNGGRVVLKPTGEFLQSSVQSFIRGRRVPFSTLLETAQALEPMLASLAAQHREEADLIALRKIRKEMSESLVAAHTHSANARWHLAVARASHNPLLIAVAEALNPLLHDPHVSDFASSDIRDEVINAHDRVQQAIETGDPDAAMRRMARHIRAYRSRIETVAPKTVVIE